MAKIDHKLFSANQHALDQAYGECPECSAKLVIKHANKSSFLACQNYPDCKHTQQLHKNDVSILKVMAGSSCPECGQELAVKKGRYGMFIGCTGFPECHYIASKDGLSQQSEHAAVTCPKCEKGELVKRQNKFGKHFYACNAYPKCKYMLNAEPEAMPCEACGWKVMTKVESQNNSKKLVCPQVNCQHIQTL
ncbi:topoisomerase DNA-binding C4 zinc finger domain-containing protein [Glaciecola sp. MH2013]|uniref:DNA topoisomerase family protein n=1 Tax=Glaciecola sp. MH2013 TaxID=2785524 RepID=UPI00189D1152|nr:topoisomerase DNA-binding C4 zinc finger domain-containing protein [Glaciecola sp. MH2013]MBF7074679.1 topoisomerase DNA-binding C4 zinc finger domain-containing protein [Glaciecola sp. MH2013]